MKRSNNIFFNKICKTITAFISIAALTAGTMGCGFSDGRTLNTISLYSMDTIMELQIVGDEALLREGESRIRKYEKLLAVVDENSDIGKLNNSGEAVLSEDVAKLVGRSLSVCDRTDGALDITIYPVLKLWGFTTGKYQVPDRAEIDNLLKNVDYRTVELDGNTCRIPEGVQIDLGSVAKGCIGQEIADFFREKGVESGLINLGGNVQCIGSKPNGEPWRVAIKSPFKDSASKIIGVLQADDVSVVTSGGYERYFEEDGVAYWHILDPTTGEPARNGLVSVTIVGKDGFLCDALSTALFVEGLDKAIEEYKSSDDFDAIFITDGGEIYITEGIADIFSVSSEYHNSTIKVVSK